MSETANTWIEAELRDPKLDPEHEIGFDLGARAAIAEFLRRCEVDTADTQGWLPFSRMKEIAKSMGCYEENT